jgi:hypothetical protein
MSLHRLALATCSLVLACGADVRPEGGGGSGTGDDGGAPSTTVTTGGTSSNGGAPPNPTTTTGGAPQGGSPSTGGSPPLQPCEAVCANVEMCFGVSCATVGVNCDDPAAQCPAACLVDASCDEILGALQGNGTPRQQACLQACGGMGTGGAGGAGTGGGSPMECGQCVFQNGCGAPCMGNPDCGGWFGCIAACGDPACYTACTEQYPAAAEEAAEIFSCSCANCGAECGSVSDPCNQPGVGTGGGGGAGGAP